MKLNDKVTVAKAFASALHEDKGQRYDNGPYSDHLEAVVSHLLSFDVTDRDLLAAGYLHDVVEDCEVPMDIIQTMFGEKVAILVSAVTDEPGVNRKERKAKTYGKIKANADALQIKLADRLANVTHSVRSGNERMFRMYKKEMQDFILNLYTPGIHEDMWDKLRVLISSEQFVKVDKRN